jgi:hypothetical protein
MRPILEDCAIIPLSLDNHPALSRTFDVDAPINRLYLPGSPKLAADMKMSAHGGDDANHAHYNAGVKRVLDGIRLISDPAARNDEVTTLRDALRVALGRGDVHMHIPAEAPTKPGWRLFSRRPFYSMTFDYNRWDKSGYRLENLPSLAPNEDGLRAPFGRRGFPGYPEAPRFLLDEKAGSLPQDLELFHDYWLVSDRTKSVFEAVDPAGIAFLACDVRLPHGDFAGPPYWLCDVIRVLDALDETRSRLKTGIRNDRAYADFGKKYYSIAGGGELVFRHGPIGGAHVFRMAHLETEVICDQAMKDACEAGGLKGVRFDDTAKL